MYIQECLILNTDGSDPILPAQICMMMHWYKISKGQGFLSPIPGGPNFFHNHSGGQPPLKIHAPPPDVNSITFLTLTNFCWEHILKVELII